MAGDSNKVCGNINICFFARFSFVLKFQRLKISRTVSSLYLIYGGNVTYKSGFLVFTDYHISHFFYPSSLRTSNRWSILIPVSSKHHCRLFFCSLMTFIWFVLDYWELVHSLVLLFYLFYGLWTAWSPVGVSGFRKVSWPLVISVWEFSMNWLERYVTFFTSNIGDFFVFIRYL
jgi:hypothetical protein